MSTRDDLRNVAIIAHVDHGKTTLVDAMLHQSGAFAAHQDIADRVMDSGDLEREKGITILAKNTAVVRDDVTINVVDTPGHADFGGEVERALAMVDGALLLVDAAEGPLPQTRFVLRKALERDLPLVLVVNKVDRGDARPAEVVDEVFDLLIELGADDDAIDIPVLYTNAKAGQASTTPGELDPNLDAVFATILSAIPAPEHDPDHPFQALVTTLDASPYLGRLALARIQQGTVKRGQQVAWMREDGTTQVVRLTELYLTEALDRVKADEAGPGDLIAVAGLDDVMIGDTLADPVDPRALPRLRVDEPSLGMTIGVNTSPLAGRSGTKLTARLIENRLRQELVGNVSLRVLDTAQPDSWEVQGRGELQLAVLVETLRREGFELTVGKPRVVLREIDGVTHEPFELLTVDVPEEHVGTVTQLLGTRNGRMVEMHHGADGWVRIGFHVPARGLIGFRTEFMTQTRGTGILHHVADGYEPWTGDLMTRPNGSLVADRSGSATTYALLPMQDRGQLFVAPGEELYEGMVIGEHSRGEDLDVNASREKKATNVRSSTAEELVRLAPPRDLSLEQSLEWIRDDEAVEVTPGHVRIRKVELDQSLRARAAKRAKWGAAPG
ncbi:translational GTPase TypA [Salsipaludibacter albus]|uniref:translational GTPase TypA n=1 Tax=Salsipaludibacter albus TaxID=2849650 RepID=UPI001EE4664D|nr:translational GTPase TypA [Salsipaludibacter albus]MBY5163526.1 translational GTPase TypA [Salsipaludibacter albus]